MADQTLHTRLLAELDEMAAGRSCDRSKAVAALRAVVELHAPRVLRQEGGGLVCPHCYDDARWPCSTLQVIADQLGLTQDQETHREEDRRG